MGTRSSCSIAVNTKQSAVIFHSLSSIFPGNSEWLFYISLENIAFIKTKTTGLPQPPQTGWQWGYGGKGWTDDPTMMVEGI